MNESVSISQELQQAIDQLAGHRTVTIPEQAQTVIDIATAVGRRYGTEYSKLVFQAAVQAAFYPVAFHWD